MRDRYLIKVLMVFLSVLAVLFLAAPLICLFINIKPHWLIIFKDSVVINAIVISIKTTVIALFIVICLGLPIAFILARYNFQLKSVIELLIELPLVLPPTVAGLLLLITFGKNGFIGKYLYGFGIQIPFTETAVILVQIFVSLPIFIKSARDGIEKVDRSLEITALTLGDTPFKVFRRITLPLAKNSIITGAIMSFARALAEFGATMMFAGNLAGKTQTLPLAIYTAMEQDMDLSMAISAVLVFISLLILWAVKRISTKEGGQYASY